MSSPWWPLADLRLTTPEVELRPLCEADLPELVAILPDDLEQDPEAVRYDVDRHTQRDITMVQGYWGSRGGWRPDAWNLMFAVRFGGRLIGAQSLEAQDFAALRVVDSWSFLATDSRGRGLGKQMRRAVLALAFGPLAAESAVTSAWHDNHASLGVSRSLGYRDNGVSVHRRGDTRGTIAHLRMIRADWCRTERADDIEIERFEPCQPFFGV
ncbi:MAG: GNAT family N-acetyltransferase [Actinomycetota bacterium]|nr:GNAT family N-acetyltransferase [Actinomycetota bacterium]